MARELSKHREDRGRFVAALARHGKLKGCDPVTLGDARRVARADGIPLPRNLRIPSSQMLKTAPLPLQRPREHRPRKTPRRARASAARPSAEPPPLAAPLLSGGRA